MNRHKVKDTLDKSTVIILEELDFIWDDESIQKFREMWEENKTISEISKYFKRSKNEIALLVMDQEMKYKIKPRSIGLGV